jgi:hypothetical protein
VNVLTHYESSYGTPGGPPTIYSFAEPQSLELMMSDIFQLRPKCQVLIVSLHKGLGHIPAKLAAYEQQISRAAIDAGADLVLGHHAHILKGIESYKGKFIFHGLGNFVTVTRALSNNKTQGSQDWSAKRKELFGFEPDPEYPTYPFHPEAKKTIIAACAISGGRINKVSYLPCFINKRGEPEIVKNDVKGQDIFDYMVKISRVAGLDIGFVWDGGSVRCEPTVSKR